MADKNMLAHVVGQRRSKERDRIGSSHIVREIGPQYNPVRSQYLNKIEQLLRSMNDGVHVAVAQQIERRRTEMREFWSDGCRVFPAPNDEWRDPAAMRGDEANTWEALKDSAEGEASQRQGRLSGIAEQVQ